MSCIPLGSHGANSSCVHVNPATSYRSRALEQARAALCNVQALSAEESKERRERLAKMRSLLFYHERKAARMKAIKSKVSGHSHCCISVCPHQDLSSSSVEPGSCHATPMGCALP